MDFLTVDDIEHFMICKRIDMSSSAIRILTHRELNTKYEQRTRGIRDIFDGVQHNFCELTHVYLHYNHNLHSFTTHKNLCI